MPYSNDAMFKLCIFGDGGVGKTTLVNKYLTGIFKHDSFITIGVDFYLKKITLNGKKISLQIWDFAGEDRFRFLLPGYLIGASGGIFMYDITRFSSLKNIVDWLGVVQKALKRKEDKFPIIMVGGKLDLEYKRAVSKEAAAEILKEYDLKAFFECSSKTGQNVNEIFEKIAYIMLQEARLTE